MSFLKLSLLLQLKICLVFCLILLCENSFSQSGFSDHISNHLTEDSKKNAALNLSENNEKTYLIQKNNILQTLNRSYTYIGSILIITLVIASFFIYRLWNQRQIIKKQNTLLAEANATKNQFFSIIAHDLRGPVLAFQNLTQKINYLNQKGEKGDVNKMLGQVDLAANNLHMLLDNLLSWSLIEENTFPYHPKPLNLKELSNEIYQLYLPLAKSKGVKLKQHIFADFIVMVDRNSLSTVIRNLINNAIKFSVKGDEVRMIAKKYNGKIELKIEDTGRGMAPEFQRKIFLLGQEKISYGTNGEKGTGLGLVLCKKFVELNKGEIFVQSELGKGTEFSISLPIK